MVTTEAPVAVAASAQIVRIGPLGPEDTDALLAVDRMAFPFDAAEVEQTAELGLEWDRTYGAYLPAPVSSALVGVNSTYTLDLPVPGGSVAAGGLTWVGVHPGHRRRGVLRAMIRAHLAAVRERGEPVSVLHASEPAIYGRFGYGQASTAVTATIPRGAALRPVPGADEVPIRFEEVDLARHVGPVGECYDAARRARPGMVSIDGVRRRKRFDDPPSLRGGAEPLRILIAEGDRAGGGAGEAPIRGFALFRRVGAWTPAGSPDGTVRVSELVATDPAAARALWGRLVDLDLTSTVETGLRAPDDPLFSWLLNGRAASPRLFDGIWVRLVDLPAALASRRYLTELDVTFAVTDELCPANAGTWRLVAGPDHATCTRANQSTGAGAEPAFAIDVRELGAAYLGSRTLEGLAAAGLVQVSDPERFVTASRSFSWSVAAWCPWRF